MSKPLSHKAFIEGFPMGIVAIAKQKNGKYRLIVSRPPNNPDPVLAEAETRLYDLIEDLNFEFKKKPFDIDEDED